MVKAIWDGWRFVGRSQLVRGIVIGMTGAFAAGGAVVGLGPSYPPAGIPLLAGKADLPTTLDYAVRVTQKDKPHFAFDIGVGQVAGNIGSIPSPTFLPEGYPQVVYVPVNLQARSVVGMGLSYRY